MTYSVSSLGQNGCPTLNSFMTVGPRLHFAEKFGSGVDSLRVLFVRHWWIRRDSGCALGFP